MPVSRPALAAAFALVIIGGALPTVALDGNRSVRGRAVALTSSPAPEALIEITQAVESVLPAELVDLLLVAPFPVVGLPLGVDEAVVLPLTGDDDAADSVGTVTVQDPDQPFPFASFAVYADAAAAGASVERTTAEAGQGSSELVLLPQYGTGATVIADRGLSLSQVRIANVVVGGLAVSENPEVGREAALAYTTAALAHLERLVTDYVAGATPVAATGPLGQVRPRELYERLLAEPLPDEGLPAGFSGGDVVPWEEGDSDLIGTIGGAYMTSGGGEAGVAFLVYPNEGAAQRKFDERVADAVTEGFDSVDVGGFSYPSRLLTFEDYGVVVVRVGYVIVIGNGALDQAVAIGFARAGVAHVERLATAAPEATPI